MTNGSVVVSLEWPVIDLAGMVAWQRFFYKLQRQIRPRHGAPHDFTTLAKEFAGCLGEIALAQHLGVFWTGRVGNLDCADVGPFQVRAAQLSTGRLILHRDDADSDAFVAAQTVIECLPRVRLAGWITGADGKRPEYWQDPTSKGRHAFFVPGDQLLPMSTLPTR